MTAGHLYPIGRGRPAFSSRPSEGKLGVRAANQDARLAALAWLIGSRPG